MFSYNKGVGKGRAGGWGAEAPPDFELMLLRVQAVAAKGRPKCIIIKKNKRGKNSFQVISSVSYTYKIKA